MESRKKASPNDYPQFSFRVSMEDKETLLREIDEVTTIANRRLNKDDRVVRKNDIIVQALHLGLQTLKKAKKK